MKYISTRGGIAPISFKEAVMMGLATDGGLLLPENMPQVSDETIQAWRGMSYPDLAHDVMSLFIDDIPAGDLKDLVDRSYSTFTHPEVVPVVQKGDVYIMELFHGPTLAFKDVALQFLGNVFEYLLKESGEKMNILGATSGDTGSAAIYGVRGKDRINIFIIHPHKRVSAIQELQMTTVTDDNVFNMAIRGTFDDGQAIVKTLFNDIPFKEKYHLGAVNSINWARILAQVVYYIYSALKLTPDDGMVDFSVPTGNFGDIFAGYVARKLLPGSIRNLVLATNENDLLTRFVNNGEYSLGKVVQTTSPSMDIQLASNFERYLYFLYDRNAERTRGSMEEFSKTGKLLFSKTEQDRIRSEFSTRSVDQKETLETISAFFKETGYVLDPHTAVGVSGGLARLEKGIPMICLSTAHPSKFGAAVEEAIGRPPEMPSSLQGLENKETRCKVLDADVQQIKEFVTQNAL
ncbi:MAG: threonine synthase [Desulfobulbaceae bacterium]|nr:threonine synthase [Desulfobulbaceae bacterium]